MADQIIEPQKETDRFLEHLKTRRALARLAILFEYIWPALWPPLGVAGLFLCAALLNVPSAFPPQVHLAALLGVSGLLVGLLYRGLRGLRRPSDTTADRRLEQATGLRHRPLTALADQPAHADPATAAIWKAHLSRVYAELRRLRVGLPRPGLARRDPRALRGGLVVALIAALVIAGPDAPSRLTAALYPHWASSPPPPETKLQAWITPPAYTGLPPVFLNPRGGAASVPAGSHVTVNVTGGRGEPTLLMNGEKGPFRTLDSLSFQSEFDLAAGGRLAVREQRRELGAWDLTVIADRPPVAAWSEAPGRAPRSMQTRLPWQVSDDYGVVSLQAELVLRDRPAAPRLVITISLPGGNPKTAHGVRLQDLTANPWAGLPVKARLIARDGAGLKGESSVAEFVLPGRPFRHPVARALVEMRKMLSVRPDDRITVITGLQALLQNPAAISNETGAYLNLAALRSLLVHNRLPTAIDEAQQRMWDLALHLEEGGAERTARELEAARQAVREAMERATADPSDANRAELERRLQELQQAIERHIEALAEQAQREHAEIPYDPDAQHLSERDFQRQAEAARQAAQQGRMDEARQRMAELERMLDQLRNARVGRAQDGQRNAERRRQGRQQMGVLQDLISREGRLLDRAQMREGQGDDPFTPLRRQFGQNGPSKPDSADQKAQRGGDQKVQEALRRALGELMQQFGDLTGQVPKGLGEADQAMRDAGQALGAGADSEATDAQRRAIEALQKGGREMGQQMAKQFGRGQTGEGQGDEGDSDEMTGMAGFSLRDGPGERDGDALGPLQGDGRSPGRRRDPLGRDMGEGTGGALENDGVHVPTEMERQRSQAIQEELRRRGADRTRPQQELDYINRLLKQF
ncbi:MAG: DUF4175 domain-containing protein [Acetobacteraceae bacterium]|nr:DUF4175 domain-containing protein [Acetobacteraceae bacterium]